jgi:hypothetical protein
VMYARWLLGGRCTPRPALQLGDEHQDLLKFAGILSRLLTCMPFTLR